MIHDAFLTFSKNQRIDKSLLTLAPFDFYPFPTGYIINGNTTLAIDQKVAKDFGDGRITLKARMDILQNFGSTDGTVTAALAIATADDDAFASNQLLIAQGYPHALANLVAGASYTLTVPPLSSVHGVHRFLFVGMVIKTVIAAGNAIFNAGALDAFVMLDVNSEPIRYASGFSVGS